MMYISHTDSTNSLMARILRGEEQEYSAVLEEQIPLLYTGFQSAGRGQTGNGWESEQGKNLLLTYLLRQPNISPVEQFELNILASVVTHQTLAHYLSDQQQETLTVKWPNDIYYGNKKLAGILVENSISGKNIQHSIAGIGININQEQWISNAPNPISIKQIIGQDTEIHSAAKTFTTILTDICHWSAEKRKTYYLQHLYRREGWHLYAEREVSIAPTMIATSAVKGQFLAEIVDILPTGELVLRDKQGNTHTYHFKQIRFVL